MVVTCALLTLEMVIHPLGVMVDTSSDEGELSNVNVMQFDCPGLDALRWKSRVLPLRSFCHA